VFERMDSSYFDWLTWSAGSIGEMLHIQHREACVVAAQNILRKYAIGWCPAEQLPCRPKAGYVAVMFLFNDNTFWTHITNKEFEIVFGAFIK